jgi:AcrR family transcriptional regulator
MVQADTSKRILDAAEVLFAEHGFAETSLRSITSKAKVNLAAVNYHFGSKKALIQAVFERFLTPFCLELEQNLDELTEKRGLEASAEEVLTVLAKTMVSDADSNKKARKKLVVFMRLLGLGYSQAQGHLRKFIRENYRPTYARYVGLLHRSAPHVETNEFFWRLHFAIGATVFAVGSIDILSDISEHDTGTANSVEEVMAKLVHFLAQGMSVDSNSPLALKE